MFADKKYCCFKTRRLECRSPVLVWVPCVLHVSPCRPWLLWYGMCLAGIILKLPQDFYLRPSDADEIPWYCVCFGSLGIHISGQSVATVTLNGERRGNMSVQRCFMF